MTLERIHLPLSLLLLLLLSLLLQPGGCQIIIFGNETGVQRFWRLHKFQRQHMDPEHLTTNNTQYCNLMMKARNMTKGICKPVNTFIHEPKEIVDAVCQEANITCKNGQPNCHQSSLPLNLTHCRQTGASKYPNCQYRASYLTKQIIVACEGKVYVPVHFDAYV
uniref:Ribonuclease A-domain domain-containing protein n=1 Tax=Vombatus ursinus TaxID=29139 RepID=A0A4X2LPU8_VOMUR